MTPNEIERKAVQWTGTTSESKETQLDRIEKKLDRLLNILENGELSTSFEKDLVSTAKLISADIDRRNEERWKNL